MREGYERANDPRLEKTQELSALEKLWHFARNGREPPVFENFLSDTLTETHPMRSFVKMGVAAQQEEPVKKSVRRGSVNSSLDMGSPGDGGGHSRAHPKRGSVAIMTRTSIS